MNWLFEAYAVMHAGFGFFAHNYANCSSTELLQLSFAAVGAALVLRMALCSGASDKMRRRLTEVNLLEHPNLHAAMERARDVIKLRRSIGLYWADAGGPQVATLGYFAPSIIISREIADALDPEELEAAFAHELQHVKNRDCLRIELWRMSLTLFALAAFFAAVLFLAFYAGAFSMNRIVAVSTLAGGLAFALFAGCSLARRLEQQAEFECDRAASAASGGPLAVAAAMVKVARLEKRTSKRAVLATTSLFSVRTFQLRIQRLLVANGDPRSRRATVRLTHVLGFCGIAIAVMGLTGPRDMQQAATEGCSVCALVVDKSDRWSGR